MLRDIHWDTYYIYKYNQQCDLDFLSENGGIPQTLRFHYSVELIAKETF